MPALQTATSIRPRRARPRATAALDRLLVGDVADAAPATAGQLGAQPVDRLGSRVRGSRRARPPRAACAHRRGRSARAARDDDPPAVMPVRHVSRACPSRRPSARRARGSRRSAPRSALANARNAASQAWWGSFAWSIAHVHGDAARPARSPRRTRPGRRPACPRRARSRPRRRASSRLPERPSKLDVREAAASSIDAERVAAALDAAVGRSRRRGLAGGARARARCPRRSRA